MGKEDILLKSYLSDAERYADLWNGALFEGEQFVKPEELTDVNPVLLKADGSSALEKSPDLIMKQNSTGQRFAVLVVENQTAIDYRMPARIMLEEALAYHKQIREIQRANEKADQAYRKRNAPQVYSDTGERLYQFKKSDRLQPVATLIVYWGEEKWQGARCLHDMMDFDGKDGSFRKQLKKLVPKYPLHFLDLGTFRHFEYFKTELRPLLELYQLKNRKEEFLKYMETERELWGRGSETLHVLSHLIHSRNLKKLIESKITEKEEKKDMSNAFDEWVDDIREESRREGQIAGIREGRIAGITAGKIESIFELLEEYGEIPNSLKEKIIKQSDMSILSRWHKLAAKANSIEDFTLAM